MSTQSKTMKIFLAVIGLMFILCSGCQRNEPGYSNGTKVVYITRCSDPVKGDHTCLEYVTITKEIKGPTDTYIYYELKESEDNSDGSFVLKPKSDIFPVNPASPAQITSNDVVAVKTESNDWNWKAGKVKDITTDGASVMLFEDKQEKKVKLTDLIKLDNEKPETFEKKPCE